MATESTLISVRLQSDHVQRCDSEAATRSRPGAKVTRTDIINEALSRYFNVVEDPPAQTDLLDEPVQKPYKCPALGCDKRFGSKAAVCPTHGRKVVPV